MSAGGSAAETRPAGDATPSPETTAEPVVGADPDLGTRRGRGPARRLLTQNGLLVILLVWVVFLAVATDGFLTRTNVLLVLRQSSTIGVVAIGATLIILLGEIDLSAGAMVSVAGVLSARALLSAGVDVGVAAVVGLLVGALAGLVNGLLVTALRINSFMATLGMMSVLGGVAFLLTGGQTLFGDELRPLAFLSNGYIAGIPFPVILMFLCYIAAWVLLNRTGYGARVYAVGNNPRASFLAGIRVDVVKAGTFTLAGLLAGLGGLMQVSRLNAASGGLGTDLLFPVITAVVLGGVSLTGGRGRIQDVLVASIFLATITNGLILLGVDGYTQQVVSGAILIAALALDRWRRA
ncbi:ABC transporter permease [Nakamurella endophytica]|uniref:Autoinducer 2 import system permease protein LsrD n=1 Tax=Nakamurella endophytica TaxID=1748367 RepID=A0A917WNN1_9ACTN|nr:ABC transporter permease [Nakamurella endophytica]GGM17526.1 sugar ABC transporter permease [Nakamurella endophytica]